MHLRLVLAPRRTPAIDVVLVVAVRIGVITRGEERATDAAEQRRGAVVGVVAALADVTRAGQRHRTGRGRHCDLGTALFGFARRRDRRRSSRDAGHEPIAVDRGNRVITWSSGTPAVATVNGNGLVTGVSAGSATITATSETKQGSSQITVTTASGTVTLTGAGDIGECGDDTDDSTAALLGRIVDAVFTSADTASPDGYYQ